MTQIFEGHRDKDCAGAVVNEGNCGRGGGVEGVGDRIM